MTNSANTIPFYDEKGNYIKELFPRYAVQRVIQGEAEWIKNKSAIQKVKPCPILSVFTNVNDAFSVRDAMNKLMALFPNDPCARHKAAGALGGGSRQGIISLNNNRIWIRVK